MGVVRCDGARERANRRADSNDARAAGTRRQRVGTIVYHPQWNTLELKWDQQTRSMSDGGFEDTLQILAHHGLKFRPKYTIIDSREFFHNIGEGTLAWRDEHIVPLYNRAGVEKFAFLATDRARDGREGCGTRTRWSGGVPSRLVRDQGADVCVADQRRCHITRDVSRAEGKLRPMPVAGRPRRTARPAFRRSG
jgi:hypothetical protein